MGELKEDALFDTAMRTSNKDSGLIIDCSPELQSNVDTFEGDNKDGTFVEKETKGSVGSIQID